MSAANDGAKATKLRSVWTSSSYELGTWSETTSNVSANAKTASEKPSRRDVSLRRSLAIRPGMLVPGRQHLAHDRFAVLLRNEREREHRGDHRERERTKEGELERDRGHRTTDRRTDREAHEVERHRDGERAAQPGRIGTSLT